MFPIHRAVAFLTFWLVPGLASGVRLPLFLPAADTIAPPTAPAKPAFVMGTDQRFTFLRDTRTPDNRPIQINLWGARVGLIFPNNVKIGVGYYFTYQSLNASEKFWREYKLLDRNIHFATVYVEKFWIRREHWEFSTPLEIGVGFSRYSLFNQATGLQESRVANSVPVGLGTVFSVKFPPLGPIRAVRWFGLSLLTGYRLSIKQDFPASPVNYNGFYYSVGPGFFFDRFTEDIARWRRNRRAKRTG